MKLFIYVATYLYYVCTVCFGARDSEGLFRLLKITINATYCNVVEDTPIIYTCVLRRRSYIRGIAYSEYTKPRILYYWFQGQKAASIALKLKDEGIIVS